MADTRLNPFEPSHSKKDGVLYLWDHARRDFKIWWTVQRLCAAFTLLVLSPIFAILYVAVRGTSKGPFIYRQARPGLNGKEFTAFKIRTMAEGADKDKARARQVLSSDPMVTPIGRVLRDLKIDELPQLMNVVRGEMALVGPRPIAASLQDELERNIPGFRTRLTVKPGLTSLPQVCIMDSDKEVDVLNDWRERFAAESHYIARQNIAYDLLVILLTLAFIGKKLLRKGLKLLKIVLVIGFAAIAFMLAACSEHIATKDFKKEASAYHKPIQAYGKGYDSAAMLREEVKVPPLQEEDAEDPVYRVGASDILAINVFGEPGMKELSVRVSGDGFIQLPFIGKKQVKGKSAGDIQAILSDEYSNIYRDPWVVVQVQQFRSRPIHLLGEFKAPGIYYQEGSMDVFKAMATARGLGQDAYLQGARLWRSGVMQPVDLYALVERGRADFNIRIKPGDTLFIPSQNDQKVYLLGSILTPGAVSLGGEALTLVKALSMAGGTKDGEALLSQVRIIRTHSALEGELILANVTAILAGRAPDIALQAEDVIYVPDTMLNNWNEALMALTPSLQAAGGVLQPFVQLKFLTAE